MIQSQNQSNAFTSGEFETEAVAWDRFDSIMACCKAFRVYREVRGMYLHPRPMTEDKSARIDRLLVPHRAAVEAGWTQGVIGVEGKRSGKKSGPAIAQALDYSRCAFELSESIPGLLVVMQWVFLFPMDKPFGDLESVMAQNRIGYVSIWGDTLTFTAGAMHGITIKADGSIQARYLPMGNKRGSR